MSRVSSDSGSWFKWLIGTAIGLIAAGSGIVALLNYFSPKSPPPTQSPPTAEQLQVWINDYDDNVEFIRDEANGSKIYNWSITIQFTASTMAFVQFEVWAFGIDGSGNEVQYQVNSSVYESNTNQVTLPSFWVKSSTNPDRPGWTMANIVHIQRLAVRVVSIEDGSILAERDFLRDP